MGIQETQKSEKTWVITARVWLTWVLIAIATTATVMTSLGFLGSLWWVFGVLDHWRGQYGWILLLSGIAIFWVQRRWGLLCLLPLVMNLVIVGALYWPTAVTALGKNTTSIRILHFNLDRHNPEPDEVLQYLDAQTVDILSLQEVTPEWAERLRSRLTHYELAALEVRENSHGSALLLPTAASRVAMIQSMPTIHLPATSDRPLLVGQLLVDGKQIALLNLHVTRPRSRATAAFQQVELASVAQWSREMQTQGQGVIVIGDFNSTPWAQGVRGLLAQGKLTNSQQGYGWQTTWSAEWPSMLRIAIDHCLHSNGLVTITRSIGPALGSDHLPLTVELGLQGE